MAEPPPDNYTGPGYYPHGMAAEPGGIPDHVRWFDGESWIGPEVSDIWKTFYEFFVKLGFNPETLRLLLLMFGAMAFLIVILLVVVLVLGGGDDDQPAATATTSSAGTTIGGAAETTTAPTTTTTAAVTSTVAPTTTATTVGAAAIDASGVWTFTWSWGVTVVGFEGEVSGEGSEWTFQGKYAGGGSSSWRPESGSATCTLSGEPLADLSTPGSMSCTVTVPEDSWTGETTGQINLVLGEVVKFEYRGGGTGTSSSTSGSPIEVHLRPIG